MNRTAGGGSRNVGRMMRLPDPPWLDEGEITDKVCINQCATLSHRCDAMAMLHSGAAAPLLFDVG